MVLRFWELNASIVEDANFVTLLNENMPTWLAESKEITDNWKNIRMGFH